MNIALLSRSLHRDEVVCSIMRTAEHFQETFNMVFNEALEHDVFKKILLIHDKLAVSISDCSMGFSDKDSFDGENLTQSLKVNYGET